MGQVIDIEERRKPRDLLGPDAAATPGLLATIGPAEMGQMLYPAMTAWRTWLASWATLWLAPVGLQVRAIELAQENQRDLPTSHR